MSATTLPVLTGPRWSSAVTCPRQAVYEAQQAPAAEPTAYQQKIWRRGNVMSDALRDEVVAEFHAKGRRPKREEQVPWPAANPIGVGHADLFVPSEALIVEITTTKGCELADRKVLQLAGYVKNHPRADTGVVISLDPSTGDEKVYPVNVDAFRDRVEEIEALVVEGVSGGALPVRACRHPGDGPGMFCPFVQHCFADWQRPRVETVEDVASVEALLAADEEIRRHKKAIEAIEVERDALRDAVRPFLTPNLPAVAGGVEVKMTLTKASESFSLADARRAGMDLDSDLRAFVKPKAQSERWTVKRIGASS